MSEKILVVAKTWMKSGICVGGLTASSNRNVRLIPEDRQDQRNCAQDTEFEVGQVWDVDFYNSTNIDPPHMEDIIVTRASYKGKVASLQRTLIQRVQPWEGGVNTLFDKNLTISLSSGKCYVSRNSPLPKCSTGYWFPDKELVLQYQNNSKGIRKPYYITKHAHTLGNHVYTKDISIPFVGCSSPASRISPDTLVRVSLARWLPSGGEERCYLQISGWYD